MRLRTDSLAIIWLTVMCLPTSREVEDRERLGPLGVVDERRLERARLEVQQPLELPLDAGDVVVERGPVEQVALLAARPHGSPTMPGRSSGQRERAVAGKLEPAQGDLAEEVADVEAVGRRIEPDVDADGTAEPGGRRGSPVGGVLHEAAGLELGEQVRCGGHGAVMVAWPRRGSEHVAPRGRTDR